ncbi:reductase [Seiridium cupressi]
MAGELVLLTGGTGFLGYAILLDLLKSGYRVRVAARSQAKIDAVRASPSMSALGPPQTHLMFVIVPDMIATGAYDDALQGVDFVIHSAAPVHAEGNGPKEQLEDAFVTTSVKGNLEILKSAKEKGKTVKRIIMTSSTVAIAPADVYIANTKEREIVRGPESRVAALAPPYDSELRAYCVGKAASLNAAEAFLRENATTFDMISIMPSWIFGKDELVTNTSAMRTGSTHVLINGLTTGNQGEGAIGNAVLCADVARAHVRALDADIEGNQSFVLNVEARWEDTVPIAKKHFPEAFESGLFREGNPQSTYPVKWDSSKARDVLGIDLASYDAMVKEVIGQYLELANKERMNKT